MSLRKYWPFVTKRKHTQEIEFLTQFYQNRLAKYNLEEIESKYMFVKSRNVIIHLDNNFDVELEHFGNNLLISWDLWIRGNHPDLLEHLLEKMKQDTKLKLCEHIFKKPKRIT